MHELYEETQRLRGELRVLRTKLLRERARWQEELAMALPDDNYHKSAVLHGRARRLRDRADLIERGSL